MDLIASRLKRKGARKVNRAKRDRKQKNKRAYTDKSFVRPVIRYS